MSASDTVSVIKEIVNLVVTMLPKIVDMIVEIISLLKSVREV